MINSKPEPFLQYTETLLKKGFLLNPPASFTSMRSRTSLISDHYDQSQQLLCMGPSLFLIRKNVVLNPCGFKLKISNLRPEQLFGFCCSNLITFSIVGVYFLNLKTVYSSTFSPTQANLGHRARDFQGSLVLLPKIYNNKKPDTGLVQISTLFTLLTRISKR